MTEICITTENKKYQTLRAFFEVSAISHLDSIIHMDSRCMIKVDGVGLLTWIWNNTANEVFSTIMLIVKASKHNAEYR